MKKLLFLLPLLILIINGCETADTSPQPTPIVWQDVTSFSGNGNAHSETFTVPAHWKMKWSCDPSSDKYGFYNIVVYKHKVPYNGDTTIPSADINTICSTGNTSGDVEENGSGSYYLEINVADNWTLTLQKPA